MPKRTDLHKILIIGSGPIVIGQGCEFDYSGTQACKVLKQEGFEVVLVNSNPATIMTDPELADRTYVEPLTLEALTNIIARERPQALLPTVGGQTALNLALHLADQGILESYQIELIGAKPEAIKVAEDRFLFKQAMDEIGLLMPTGEFARTLDEALAASERIGFPAVIRPSFTLGGSGGGIARNQEELVQLATRGLRLSPIREILIEESIQGWKEYELEVMRDLNDNVVVVCSIENFDPMGIHTGDSITVAPAQTLTDLEYQQMVDAAIQVIRKVGVETGGSNIQFAVNPRNGKLYVIEMNPRVSRSSALASKATGFPIAKIAAKLAVGYTLDEIPNDITRETLASFEPVIDYVVVKIPKWAFEKFPAADATLGTQMKSVGEVMAIGRTFKEALLKGLRSLESGTGWKSHPDLTDEELQNNLTTPNSSRLSYLFEALSRRATVEFLYQLTGIDHWFLEQLKQIVAQGSEFRVQGSGFGVQESLFFEAKRMGFSDELMSQFSGIPEETIRRQRSELGIKPVYKRVDSCSAEFESYTPYLYSTYEDECEVEPTDRKKIIILGSGPNRIGQGIEFDYCCCHASFALKGIGYETIMVNCNPETVSTDYDTSDRLYFEPITFEDVMHIVEKEKPVGVIVQFGGQTPLKLAQKLAQAGVPIIGTSPDSIHLAEDRQQFGRLLVELGIPHPAHGTAVTIEEARTVAARIGYPVLVRPSYVLGGRAMVVVYNQPTLERYMQEAAAASPDHPVLIDRFLEGAIEVDIDALSDGCVTVIAGIQEHIEAAGIHSGDSSCVMPPMTLTPRVIDEMCEYTRKLATALNVVGLINVQFAVKDDHVWVLEVNPRASRSVPYVSKTTGVPIANIAACLMVGHSLNEFHLPELLPVEQTCVKVPVFPFAKFPGVDPILGPEMRSTGEVMGIAKTFGMAYLKALDGANVFLPREGSVYLSVQPREKEELILVARRLHKLGFYLMASTETAATLVSARLTVQAVNVLKDYESKVVNELRSRQITLVISTNYPPNPLMTSPLFENESKIRSAALQFGTPCITTLAGARAALKAIDALQSEAYTVRSLQEHHEFLNSKKEGSTEASAKLFEFEQ